MCWTPELIEFPCRWPEKNDIDPDELREMGIEPELKKGTVCLDVKSILRVNESDHKNCTTLQLTSGELWTVDVSYENAIKILRKCGVNVRTANEVLEGKNG